MENITPLAFYVVIAHYSVFSGLVVFSITGERMNKKSEALKLQSSKPAPRGQWEARGSYRETLGGLADGSIKTEDLG